MKLIEAFVNSFAVGVIIGVVYLNLGLICEMIDLICENSSADIGSPFLIIGGCSLYWEAGISPRYPTCVAEELD